MTKHLSVKPNALAAMISTLNFSIPLPPRPALVRSSSLSRIIPPYALPPPDTAEPTTKAPEPKREKILLPDRVTRAVDKLTETAVHEEEVTVREVIVQGRGAGGRHRRSGSVGMWGAAPVFSLPGGGAGMGVMNPAMAGMGIGGIAGSASGKFLGRADLGSKSISIDLHRTPLTSPPSGSSKALAAAAAAAVAAHSGASGLRAAVGSSTSAAAGALGVLRSMPHGSPHHGMSPLSSPSNSIGQSKSTHLPRIAEVQEGGGAVEDSQYLDKAVREAESELKYQVGYCPRGRMGIGFRAVEMRWGQLRMGDSPGRQGGGVRAQVRGGYYSLSGQCQWLPRIAVRMRAFCTSRR